MPRWFTVCVIATAGFRNYCESQSYLLDDDGAIHYDHGSQGSADEATRFEEHVVQTGDEVVVFGLYSAARNAVVPDPQSEVLRRAPRPSAERRASRVAGSSTSSL